MDAVNDLTVLLTVVVDDETDPVAKLDQSACQKDLLGLGATDMPDVGGMRKHVVSPLSDETDCRFRCCHRFDLTPVYLLL